MVLYSLGIQLLRNWLKASLLEQGMILLDRNNQEVEVLSQFLIPNHTDTVYNIEVDDFHTYHVGRLGVWVHNADCCELKLHPQTHPTSPFFFTKVLWLSDGVPCK
ncbi:Protein of uncharacterised function (DUF1557) [Moraxella lacunata]|uniref:Protein of uncharacterized function (DUF1557) n=1 Tax=Moraxella lacunata TaxID=477 RepID=A0A378TUN3_MORLA|nr:Protein of uncharacterised function (DUF1557) [Moraxella lacunata]